MLSILWTVDEYETISGERCGVSPPVQPRSINANFQNTHHAVPDRAEIQEPMDSKENQPRFSAIWTSLSSASCQTLRFGPELIRFSENRTLKTENSSASTGFLEQMP
jgi:hypothetical protein